MSTDTPVEDSVAEAGTGLAKIVRLDLALETATRLAQLVASSEPGSRLPTERELCARLGVGRSTLREAVRSLAFIGAIQPRQGSGTYVSSHQDQPVERLIGLGLMLQRSSVQEVIEVRRVLEVEAVRMAAERHDDSDRREIETVIEAMNKVADDPAEAARHDVQFHVLLGRASHNSVLDHLIHGMRRLLEIWIAKAVNRRPVVEDILREHKDVAQAVFRRDQDRAAALMFIHLTNAADRLMAVLGRDHSAANYISVVMSPNNG